jgi:hypothetical protein
MKKFKLNIKYEIYFILLNNIIWMYNYKFLLVENTNINFDYLEIFIRNFIIF